MIDQNDELCILYERFKQQKDILSSAESTLQRKDEELRMLRLQSEELQRQYLAASRRLPEVDELKRRLKDLESDLQQERRNTEDISAKLETPETKSRWRELDGEDPDQEQLSVKIKLLEDRVEAKRELMLERGLVLQEITELTTRLRDQAMSRRDDARSKAEHLSLLQGRIRDTTKKMLATVSELSMYQVRICLILSSGSLPLTCVGVE